MKLVGHRKQMLFVVQDTLIVSLEEENPTEVTLEILKAWGCLSQTVESLIIFQHARNWQLIREFIIFSVMVAFKELKAYS